MKRKMKLAVFAFASAALLVSCVKDNGVVETSFQISAATEDNKIVVTVEPSEASAVYSIGIIMEDDWNRIGGEQGLKAYADSLIASGTETVSGQGIGRYEDLYWQTKYYVFAAQVNDGHVVGTPEYKEANIYRPYVEFDAGDLIIAPASVSDNGMYIVGNYYDGISRNSYIYDVRRDSLSLVSGISLYDVTDDGTAYGSSGFYPVIWKGGEVSEVRSVGSVMESGFYGVTPDGSVAVGYMMDDNWKNIGFVYENGTLTALTAHGLDNGVCDGFAPKGIGSNGNISGYIQNSEPWAEVGCAWTGASHDFEIYPEDLMEWDSGLLDGSGAFGKRYGTVEARISPDGRYYAGTVTVTESWEYMPDFPYLYDAQEGRMYEISGDAYQFWRADAVSSSGLLFLSDVNMGISSQPYIYSPADGKVITMAEWAKAEYGYEPDGFRIQGSVVAVSGDCMTIVGDYAGDNSFVTAVWFMPM